MVNQKCTMRFVGLFPLCLGCDEHKNICIHSFSDILKACQHQYNMQHVQGRQVKYGTCWQSITETLYTAGQTKQAMEGSGNGISGLLPQSKQGYKSNILFLDMEETTPNVSCF